MATLYVPRCGQGMVEDFTSGVNSSSPSTLSALAAALASAGVTGSGGVKASGNIPISGSFSTEPAQNTLGSVTIPTGGGGIAIISASCMTTAGTAAIGFNSATLILYKNSQLISGGREILTTSVSGPASFILESTAIVPVVPGDVITVKGTRAGVASISVDTGNAYAYYVVI